MHSASSRVTRSRMSIAISTITRSAPVPERNIAMAASMRSAWVADAPLSAAICTAAVSWVPMVSNLTHCLLALVPFRGVKRALLKIAIARAAPFEQTVVAPGVTTTEGITAELRPDDRLGKFCRADDLDLVNGVKNRGRSLRPHRSRGPIRDEHAPTRCAVHRFEIRIICCVIPGRREAASPESITTDRGLWIPGSPPSVAPRNDRGRIFVDGSRTRPSLLAILL